ncbi:unnamed protein product [Tilletia controversa]|uniref:Enoyl reductase (ER) domain-containing protein n=1 Tax=Tilletia controversa TaxID=13291 RepID=A0A8X7T0E5_9BASI|nr:hypothetical protein CF328_g549 [Tilletia controversa]KAE8255176.1 hypothetical protein A4X06_0g562 [Tilletia controversa]CAD6920767.1 unnamed protein product [Tilletia controversa]CAD6930885.1 unnamed protein product [Tilletia controversa]CAD6952068.1 unnamed protein product [Tilletia controversa]
MSSTNKTIVLRERPEADINPSLDNGTFALKEESVPSELKNDEVLVKVLYVSLDPAMRGWLRDVRSYLPPVQINEVMRAAGVGQVVKSNSPKFKEGDHVSGRLNWQQFSVLQDKFLQKIDVFPGVHVEDFLGVLGSSGQTAYWGLHDIIAPKKGDTIVVTGAAGSVGSIVVQLAKIAGATVVAVAGGSAKCAWLKDELKADHALDYKEKGFLPKYKKLLKDLGFIDACFENVGGDLLDTTLALCKPHARIALCGAISGYNDPNPKGLQNYMSIIGMRIKLEGFIVLDYQERYGEAAAEMSKYIKSGELKTYTTVVDGGVERAPSALVDLFAGANKGKMVCKIA